MDKDKSKKKRIIPLYERRDNVWAEISRIELQFGWDAAATVSQDINDWYHPKIIANEVMSEDLNGTGAGYATDKIQSLFSEYSKPIPRQTQQDTLRIVVERMLPNRIPPKKVTWTYKGKKIEKDFDEFFKELMDFALGIKLDIPPDFEIVAGKFIDNFNRQSTPK